jgi:hypothetical protein
MPRQQELKVVKEEDETPPDLPRLVIVALEGTEFKVQLQGIEAIAAPTLLRLAAKQVEKQLELGE